ncbi:class I SAM-dependent methyltransferase [Saccharothrix longispora]|uniref:class I SAM-dependent methyltransferase n=1 Tax=Saccharothrix longispora TaxID=33920 RepID=UPI0028FD32B7|nr:class I SAM-dependent methyltransferase [Saccharothrix longispora]MDU0294810.1 class I SAM-dependent methyltransferase [Saccharothrix longispora]
MTEKALTTAAQDWEEQARNWIAWVRRPGFDSYWRYRDAFFALVPAAGRATLDLGCGEGRVSRDLGGRGHRVTGVDASPTLLEAARQADPGGRYLLADAAGLPLPDGGFDLVVAYNVLMDVDDLPGTVAEIGRVLEPGGRLCLSITHPITNTGSRRGGLFVLDRPYFGRHRFEEEVERDGMRMRFSGWNHPLSAYAEALEDAGLLIEALREPRVGDDDVPWHLWIRAVRPRA